MYKVNFKPVLDCVDGESPEEELEAINKWCELHIKGSVV